MSTNAILRAAVVSAAALCLTLVTCGLALGQYVGADVGGGAGIFRAKNPETKRAAKPAAGAKPGTRTPGPTRPKPSNVEERVEDLLDKGNQARDARNFAEAESA